MRLMLEQVSLRKFTYNDILLKVRWINNPDNNRFLHYDLPLTVEGTKRWYENKDNNSRIDCTIEYDGIPVGVIGLLQIDKINQKAEYYITVGESSLKRKGVATKATQLILKYGFETLGLRKIYLNVDEKNVAACALYEKIGFQCEGVFKEDMYFRGEWINRKRYAIFNLKQVDYRSGKI